MNHRRPLVMLLALLLALACLSQTGRAQDNYPLGPDSQYQPGVPKGTVTHHTWTSKIFPGTVRDYWVYVPQQYDSAKPACVMVFQDGGGYQDANGQFRVPVVFDNLIHKGEMPVTIAIMINPGVVPAANPNALPRFNRSYEYDGLSDQYVRFLLEEILPEVGKTYHLTGDPNGRALGGASSGGICAFTAAWERPDAFRRVLSFVGSFTNLRGGHNYASLIRKHEPKPLRIFLQDGSNDQDIYSGSWFLGNNDVAAALKFAGYDYRYVVGTGGHNGIQGGAILPDALRWLWRDYPAPIQPSKETRQPIMGVLESGEAWQSVSGEAGVTRALAARADGAVFFATDKNEILWIGTDNTLHTFAHAIGDVTSMAFAPSQGTGPARLLTTQPGKKRIMAYEVSGKETVIASGIATAQIVVNSRGEIYAADARDGRLWRIREKTKPQQVGVGSAQPGGLALTPDQTLLLLSQSSPGKVIMSYQIAPDGGLANAQPYFDVYLPYDRADSAAGGMATDTQGWLYVATAGGIQMCDQAGRVNGIIGNPEGVPTTQIVFGGPNRDTLYAIAGGRLYKRKMKVKGVYSFEAPLTPPAPRL